MNTEQADRTRPLHDFHDIADLMDQIGTTHRLYDGAVLLALVRDPETTQEIVQLSHVPAGAYADDATADKQLDDLLTSLPVEERREIRYRTLTIVCRRGYTVMGEIDLRWSNALKYGWKPGGCLTTAQVVVTEHGWAEFMTGEAGHEPALADASR
ncbi:MAG: hypothetical protein L0K86_01815 [Actinomycetia bacterium]|nr:hypothetical protein [Actinomycetes bacterium]